MFQYISLQSFTHQKHQNRTIKTTILQQYTSFVFPFAETRSVMWRQLTERIQKKELQIKMEEDGNFKAEKYKN